MLIYFDAYDWLIGFAILGVLLPILWRRKRSLSYLLFFSIFWIYLLAVVQAVFFPFAINTDNSGAIFRPSINLIPFYFGDCFMPEYCIRGILENIVLTIPFGLGINFLARVKPRNILWLAPAFGFGLELSQLLISLAFRSGFRAVDINDALLNAGGVLLGYGLFRAFAWLCLKITAHYKIVPKGLFAEIYAVASRADGRSKNG